MISQIPDGAAGLDQLVCDGKTIRGSAIETEDGNHRFVAQVTVYARALGVALTVKSNQPTLYRQIGHQFEGKRRIPFTATDQEKRHGRDTRREIRAKEAPDHIKEAWPGSAWIVELITTTTKRNGRSRTTRHDFITTLRTTPEALLRLIRQRWSIENEWHWARDTQLGEDAHRYANRIGAPVFAFLRTIVMNLLRRAGYRSIRRGLRELAYDIPGMLALGGVQVAEHGI
jgi:predicted transposase YbfD/YdcC